MRHTDPHRELLAAKHARGLCSVIGCANPRTSYASFCEDHDWRCTGHVRGLSFAATAARCAGRFRWCGRCGGAVPVDAQGRDL